MAVRIHRCLLICVPVCLSASVCRCCCTLLLRVVVRVACVGSPFAVCLFVVVFPLGCTAHLSPIAQRSAIRRPRSQPASSSQQTDRHRRQCSAAHPLTAIVTPITGPSSRRHSQTAAADGRTASGAFLSPLLFSSRYSAAALPPTASRRCALPLPPSAAPHSSAAEQSRERSGVERRQRSGQIATAAASADCCRCCCAARRLCAACFSLAVGHFDVGTARRTDSFAHHSLWLVSGAEM